MLIDKKATKNRKNYIHILKMTRQAKRVNMEKPVIIEHINKSRNTIKAIELGYIKIRKY